MIEVVRENLMSERGRAESRFTPVTGWRMESSADIEDSGGVQVQERMQSCIGTHRICRTSLWRWTRGRIPPSGCWPEAPQQAADSPHPAPTQLVTVGTEGTYQGRGVDDGEVVAKLKSPTNASCTDSQEQDPVLNLRREGSTQSD